MKRIIWVLLAILPLCLHAQYVVKHDVNEQFEYMTDYQWNKWNRGFVLNGEFIKNPIGINLNKVEKVHKALPFTIKNVGAAKDSILVPKGWWEKYENKCLPVKGFNCHDITLYVSKEHPENVELYSLDEIRKLFCPKVKGKVVYMIYKFFIMDNEELYRLDPTFVYRVETVKSKDIKVLSDQPEFTLVRIFTWTTHNVFPDKLGY